MPTLLWIILSTLTISLIAFIGVLTLFLQEKIINKLLMFFVALSAGALMGGAFLHLLPEVIEEFPQINAFVFVLVGFALFFVVEKVLHWRHCHKGHCEVHSFAYMNLLGDGIHNFIDGLIIAASFVVDVKLGITTSLAVALHEIPQEIGDFGVLVYGGFRKSRALFMNFASALLALLGGIIGYFLSGIIENSMGYLLAFAAGGFIYIAATDLVPEIKKELNIKKYSLTFAIFILGISLMYALKFLE